MLNNSVYKLITVWKHISRKLDNKYLLMYIYIILDKLRLTTIWLDQDLFYIIQSYPQIYFAEFSVERTRQTIQNLAIEKF